jgi:hypothetical protein
MAYLLGIVRSILGGLWWWASLFAAYFFQAATFSDYPEFRDKINAEQTVFVMPPEVPLWALLVPFFLWVVARLAHKETMRYLRAGRVIFDKIFVEPVWKLWISNTQSVLMSSVVMVVKNSPYKTDSGNDIEDAWANVKLFDLDSKPLREHDWDYPRWVDNGPPYIGGFNHDLDFRTLKANRSPNRVTLFVKEFSGETASRLRGIDQSQGWKDPEHPIPPGDYLVRVTIMGKGLQEDAVQTFKLRNPGKSAVLEVSDIGCRIEKYWPQ